ncbi:MAG TPA: c-type cytochrome, partial [Flavitalea sp.]|nr:c-type cytochrome [Flavitalea sp.]
RKPRMLTIALDTACYAAYDLANCKLYKVWKGGVLMEGAAYTDKKNIQPTSWGTAYSDNIHNKWIVNKNNQPDSFKIISRGYRFNNNSITLLHYIILSTHDTMRIEEVPEFISDNNHPVFQRTFTTNHIPEEVVISLASANDTFQLPVNGIAVLANNFKPLPQQFPVAAAGEYDHRGRLWMEKSDCFTCHEIDKNTVGPSLQEIAGRYGNQENPSGRLISNIKMGSTGVWGTNVMTPHADLTENEIRVMLDYIFTLKPNKNPDGIKAVAKTADKNIHPGFGAPLESIHPSFDIQTIHKSNFRPRVGGIAFMPDGRLLVTTWDTVGGVYILDHVGSGDTNKINVKRIAAGLAEPLGIEVVNGEIFVLQKQELTQLIDHNGDEVIDEYRTVCNSWGVTGDFHEFSFGLVYKDGYFYATLSMAMRLMLNEKQKQDRGRTIKISRDGSFEWVNYGLRTPNGIGIGPDGELFETDNQGEWVPANKLIHLKKGEYHGMRWGHLDSLHEPPPVALPAIYLPENEIGNSPSEPVLITDGMYKGQMLHGDVTYGGIQRDFLEKVNGDYQGCVFRFTQGLEAGINRLRVGPDGALYAGGVGMVGGWSWKEKQYGLQRIKYNGRPVFEMLAVHAMPDGFDIELTDPVSDTIQITAGDLLVQQWWYLPTQDYGGPKKDMEQLTIKEIRLSDDRKHIYIRLPGMKEKRVVYIRLPEKLKSSRGQLLWSGETWYTLNKIPVK